MFSRDLARMETTQEQHVSSRQEPPTEKLEKNISISRCIVIPHRTPFPTQTGRKASFHSHRIQPKSQQNWHESPGALIQPLHRPEGSWSSKRQPTAADFIPIGISHSRPLSTLRWCLLRQYDWYCWYCCIFYPFFLSSLSRLLTKVSTIIEFDLSNKSRKLN